MMPPAVRSGSRGTAWAGYRNTGATNTRGPRFGSATQAVRNAADLATANTIVSRAPRALD